MAESAMGRVKGPLGTVTGGLSEELTARGYSAGSVERHLRLLTHLGRWLEAEGLSPAELTCEVAERFVAARRRRGDVHGRSQRGLAPLLGYLRSVGAVPAPMQPVAGTPLQRIVEAYVRYLSHERGLAAVTVRHYAFYARLFLSQRPEPVDAGLTSVSAQDVTAFVLAQCRSRSVGWARNLITALRCLLRFLFLEGYAPRDLACAVPAVAAWRAGALPTALPASDVARLLDTCERDRRAGRRDLAILTLLARLGLRAKEVAALELGDIDWRAGEIVVRGKGGRRDRLPLPTDVGEAIVDYLRDGRPACASHSVFVLAVAPWTGISAKTVGGVVAGACRRAGLPPAGSHRLRHTAATEMLRGGASLPEVGQVLRQRNTATTAIYANVDAGALSALARPWPGRAS